jgi:hypothetical protein
LKRIQRITAIAVTASLLVVTAPKPVRSQVQFLAPAACATGVGCVLIGVVTAVGVGYFLWQDADDGEEHRIQLPSSTHIEDAEEEIEAMGNNTSSGRVVVATSASAAQSACERWAGYRRTGMPQSLGNNRWRCQYY